ncbi:MAG: ADP-ribosylation factor-like protein [Candidatus Heimdallarchaeota archaeon]
MKLQENSEKRIPIAIVGLENAGKTTLTNRLQTGRFEPAYTVTRGLDVETADIRGQLFQLFDLGGHLKFRELFWKTYVQLSQGIIFVIDVNDQNKLAEATNWFWKCLEWNTRVPLLILANKSDLPHIELDELIDRIGLANLPKQNSARSFRLFEVSNKSGKNLTDAFDWFSQKIIQDVSQKKIKLVGIYLYLPTGIPIASHRFTSNNGGELSEDVVPGFLYALDQFASGVIGPSEGLNSVTTESGRILMVKREGVMCAIVTDKKSDPVTSRVIAESFLNYIESSFSKDLVMLKEEGKSLFPKDFIVKFLKQEFAQNLIQ